MTILIVGTPYKFPQNISSETKLPSKATSLISTKTLKQTNVYHGSDGILQGALDLVHNQQSPKISIDAKQAKRSSIVSTKTLENIDKYHGSDGKFHGAIDLTNFQGYSRSGSPQNILETSHPNIHFLNEGNPIESTASLVQSREFHGSDDHLHGSTDLLKLKYEIIRDKNLPDASDKTVVKERRKSDIDATHIEHGFSKDVLHLGRGNEPRQKVSKTVVTPTKSYDFNVETPRHDCSEYSSCPKQPHNPCINECKMMDEKNISNISRKWTYFPKDVSNNTQGEQQGNEAPYKEAFASEKDHTLHAFNEPELVSIASTHTLTSEHIRRLRTASNGVRNVRAKDSDSSSNIETKAVHEPTRGVVSFDALTNGHSQRSKVTKTGSASYAGQLDSGFSERARRSVSDGDSSENTSQETFPSINTSERKDIPKGLNTALSRNAALRSINGYDNNGKKPTKNFGSSSFHKDLRNFKSHHVDVECKDQTDKNCRCQKCMSTMSISEPDMQRQHVNKDSLKNDECIKKKTIRVPYFVDDRASIVSTKTLNMENVEQIRSISRGKTNISELNQRDDFDEIKGGLKSDDKMSTRTLQVDDMSEFNKESKGTIDTYDLPLRQEKEKIKPSEIQKHDDGVSIVSTKTLNVAETDELRKKGRGLSNITSSLSKKENLSLNTDDFQKFRKDVISTKTINSDSFKGLRKVSEVPKRGCLCKNSSKNNGSIDKRVSSTIKKFNETKKSKEKPGLSSCTQVHTKFEQSRESSAEFHKVFSIDGVGLQCHCSISSFNKNNKRGNNFQNMFYNKQS